MTVFAPLKRFVDVGRPVTYGIVQAGEDVPDGVPYIRPVDMNGHRGVDPVVLRTTSHEIARAYKRSSLLPGDVVVSIGPSYGKTMVVPDVLEGANLTQGTARVAAAPGVSARYLVWALQSATAVSFWDSAVGGATFRALNLGPLVETPIPAWASDEQRRIADFLDAETSQIDTLIAEQERFIGLLNERRDAAWSARLDEAAQLGPTLPIRRVIESIVDGPFGSSLTSAHYADHGSRVIRLGNIGTNEFKGDDAAFIPDDYARELSQHQAQAGDVVMAGLGDENQPLGRAALVPDIGKAIVKADCFRLRPGRNISGAYLAWALSAPPTRARIALLARGSTRQRINTTIARAVEIPVPDPTVQDAVLDRSADDSSRIDTLIREARYNIMLSKERRAALITAAVTGQIDVSTGKVA